MATTAVTKDRGVRRVKEPLCRRSDTRACEFRQRLRIIRVKDSFLPPGRGGRGPKTRQRVHRRPGRSNHLTTAIGLTIPRAGTNRANSLICCLAFQQQSRSRLASRYEQKVPPETGSHTDHDHGDDQQAGENPQNPKFRNRGLGPDSRSGPCKKLYCAIKRKLYAAENNAPRRHSPPPDRAKSKQTVVCSASSSIHLL